MKEKIKIIFERSENKVEGLKVEGYFFKIYRNYKIMNNNDLKNLREDLIGELQAINQYQQHIDESDNEEIKKVLSHIRDDEKEHVAELVKLIQELDATQKEKFQKEGL